MNYQTISIYDDTHVEGLEILKKGLTLSTSDAYFLNNYHPDQNHLGTNLFYLLKKGRFKSGAYQILIDDSGTYISSAGWYINGDQIIAMSRAYIAEKYRGESVLTDFLLPEVLNYADKVQKCVWMTFNEKNKSIYNTFERLQSQGRFGLGDTWPKTFRHFHPIGQRLVNNVNQYVVEYRPGTRESLDAQP